VDQAVEKPTPEAVGNLALRAKASAAYASESRQAYEEELILKYLPLVRHVVQKVAAHLSAAVDTDDLISAGALGLVRAARAFDPSHQATFKTYAYIRIRGAVLDEIRDGAFVSPAVHQNIRRAERSYQLLATRLGHPPEDAELAEEMGITSHELYRILEEARKQQFLSIHGLDEESPALGRFLPADGAPSPEDEAERREILGRLAEAIKQLPERDRLMLLLYYERDLTMKEIAAVLGVTESRVSQLHASAVFKLSMRMRSRS